MRNEQRDDTAAAAALPVAERLPVLDILRGFALMGILIMNMPGFSASFFVEADGSHLWTQPWDRFAEGAREALFSGKFNSMFSLLFGIGFTIQYARMQQRDPARATGTYLRRLLALLVFGLVHAFVFWPGDVLHTYALLGIVLVLGLRRVSDRTIIALIVAALLYPAVNGLVRLAVITPEITAARVRLDQAFEASNNAAFGAGGFVDMVRENTRMMLHFYTDWLNLWGAAGWYVMLGMTMLIGVLAGRRRWVQRIPELMPRIRRFTWWALGIGLVCGVGFAVIFELNRAPGPSPIKLLGSICYSVSRLALMIFYVLVIVRVAQSERGRRWLAPWRAAGRLPLTNYLMQSAICLVLFQHWGFGLWLKVGPALGLVLALAIFFVIQVPWSLWWLKRHERGPMEALWARLTYGAVAAPASGEDVKRPRAA
ncbi:MAG: DUF418 domain-containing protein [Rubrivivax sp.]|nr:DUF418 domain-containing protein [Rubrivivax sp.]